MWSGDTGVKECQERPTGPCWGTLLEQGTVGHRGIIGSDSLAIRNVILKKKKKDSIQNLCYDPYNMYDLINKNLYSVDYIPQHIKKHLHFMPLPRVQVKIVQVI